jgi:hypothetical protein
MIVDRRLRGAYCLMMEAVRTSETSVDNYFTRQYNPEDSSEHSVDKVVQKQNMNFSVTVKLMKSSVTHVSEKTDCFEEYESRAKDKCHIDD